MRGPDDTIGVQWKKLWMEEIVLDLKETTRIISDRTVKHAESIFVRSDATRLRVAFAKRGRSMSGLGWEPGRVRRRRWRYKICLPLRGCKAIYWTGCARNNRRR